MLQTVLLTFALVVASVFVHYELFRAASNAMPRMAMPPRYRLLVVIGVAFVAHIIEICLFSLGYWLMEFGWGLGAIVGPIEGDWMDFFYFSAASYTTLGMGDLLPTGEMRILASVESLAGLVLIGWSASFTYLAMAEFWNMHEPRE